jgi:hypothetical protein
MLEKYSQFTAFVQQFTKELKALRIKRAARRMLWDSGAAILPSITVCSISSPISTISNTAP